jgi:hypothetical protein
MQPDGFGGEAVLITADYVLNKSTHQVITDFLVEIDPATAAARPHEQIRPNRQFLLHE